MTINQLLKKISFERLGGSKEELDCANILLDELKEINLEGLLEEFEVDYSEILEAKLEILEPFQKSYQVTGYKMSGQTPDAGLTAEIIYVEAGVEVNLKNVSGKICLINGTMGYKLYKELIKAGAIGFIAWDGSIYDDMKNSDLDVKSLRARHYDNGKIPGVTLRAIDAQELLFKNANQVKLTLKQNESKRKSQNVIATIQGNEYPKEIICFTAHYDSVPFSKGAYDNATGSVLIMELAKYFSKNAPKRTLKFIWCGSEEMGLLGSKAYTEAHKDELEDYKLCINVDMVGNILGFDKAVCTSEQSLVHYIDYFAKEVGFATTVQQGVYSSDSTPFAHHNVPAVSFARLCGKGGAEIHSRKDVITPLSEKYIKNTTSFVLEFSKRMDNSYVIPVPKKIPDNMRQELDKYLGLKED